MKFGIFLGVQISPDESLARQIDDSAEQVRAARDAGFDLICTGQHFLSAPYAQPATLPFLARMAADAGDMEIAAAVILVPLHNPVDIAENVATMDAICNGRFIFGRGHRIPATKSLPHSESSPTSASDGCANRSN